MWIVGLLGAAADANDPNAPAGSPSEAATGLMVAVAAMGVCVLTVWIVRRLIYPRKFSLRTSPGRPNRIHPLLPLGLFVLWVATTVAVTALPGGKTAGPDGPVPTTQRALVAGVFAQVVWLAASLVVAWRFFRWGLRRGAGLTTRHWTWDVVRAAIGYLAAQPLCLGALYLTRLFVEPSEHPILEMMLKLHWGWLVLAVVSATVLAPLAEELFFRGVVQSMLRHYTGRPWVAILIASAIFAGVHPNTDAMPALFLLGVVLGYNYERTGRLLPSILIHALNNAMAVMTLLMGT